MNVYGWINNSRGRGLGALLCASQKSSDRVNTIPDQDSRSSIWIPQLRKNYKLRTYFHKEFVADTFH